MSVGKRTSTGAGKAPRHAERDGELESLRRNGRQAAAEAALIRANERLERQADQLAASAALLQATLEATIDAVIAVDLEGRVVVHNSRFERVWGLPAGMLRQKDFSKISEHIGLQIHDKPRYLRAVERTRSQPDSDLGSELYELTDDRIFERYASPQWIEGRCVGVVISWRDVTVRERAAEAQQAMEVAERTSRARSEFLARMSHELRTPLNAVIGFADLLQLDDHANLTADQRRFIGYIRRAGANLLLLMNDVLDISRVDAGLIAVELTDVDAQPLIDEVIVQVAPQAHAAGVSTVAQLPAGMPIKVRADRTRLRQVLLNLVTNAIKYNRAGGHVTVSARAREGRAQLVVTDDGWGMDDRQIAALFQPFNRLGREHGDVEGTGIGLVIARSLTELMGGRLLVCSRPGKGSAFTVELDASCPENARVEVDEMAPAPLLFTKTSGCVLYIDDNEVNRLLMEAFMTYRPNIQMLLAAEGERGLALARAHTPGLILMDILLPGQDGFALLRQLRAEPTLVSTPCVVVSASAMPNEIGRAMAAGFDGYLTKPLALNTLLLEIDRWLAVEEKNTVKD